MEKISDLLGINLDDPDVRMQLLLAFKADGLKSF
jgi:DNA-binding PucR family transcriptional regulator